MRAIAFQADVPRAGGFSAPYVEHYPPDTQAASLWLRNRQPKRWRDKKEHELAGDDGGPVEFILDELDRLA